MRCTPPFFSTWGRGDSQEDAQKQIGLLRRALSHRDARLGETQPGPAASVGPTKPLSLGVTVSVLVWLEGRFLLFGSKHASEQHHVRVEQGSGCSTAARPVPVSLVSCHITSLQNWFLLPAFHPNISLTVASPGEPQLTLAKKQKQLKAPGWSDEPEWSDCVGLKLPVSEGEVWGGDSLETPVPRAAATALRLDKALIEQEQEWSCRRDPLWLGLRSNGAVPRMIKY